jgi:hypothetical protein
MTFFRSSSRVIALLALACVVFCGCGDSGPKRYRISGTVTHEGKPVPVGTVMFEPDSSKGNKGAAGATAIKDGKFDSEADGVGFIGGPHRITVQAFDGVVVNEEFAPHGTPLDDGDLYVESFDLPEGDATLDIELTERSSSSSNKNQKRSMDFPGPP